MDAPAAQDGGAPKVGKLVLAGNKANIESTGGAIDANTPFQLVVGRYGQVQKLAGTGESVVSLRPRITQSKFNEKGVKVEGKSSLNLGNTLITGEDVPTGGGRLFVPATEGLATLDIGRNGGIEGTLGIKVGTVNNGGTLNPGLSDGDGIGTLAFNGNLTETAGSTLNTELAADGSADLVAVSGLATLTGSNLHVTHLGAGTLDQKREYTVLTYGHRDGAFRQHVVTVDGLRYHVKYVDNADGGGRAVLFVNVAPSHLRPATIAPPRLSIPRSLSPSWRTIPTPTATR